MASVNTRSLAVLAALLSSQTGVDVRSEGESAYCYRDDNGRGHIVVPAVADESKVPLYRGYIDHEVAHLMFTDFNDIAGVSGFVKNLQNVFEDYVIEERMARKYPGCAHNLRELCRAVNATYVDMEGVNNPAAVAQQILNFTLARTLMVHADRVADMQPIVQQYRDWLQDYGGIAPDVITHLEALVSEVSACTCTADTRALAERTYAYLQNVLPTMPDADAGQAPDPSQQSQPQQPRPCPCNAGQGQGQDQSGPSGQGQGQAAQSADGDDADGDQPGDSASASSQSSDGDDGDDGNQSSDGAAGTGRERGRSGGSRRTPAHRPPAGDAVADALDCTDPVDTGSRIAEPFPKETGSGKRCFLDDDICKPAFGPQLGFTTAGADLSHDILATTAALQQRLATLLQSRVMNREGYQRRGRLDQHRLARVAVGDPRVFTRRTERIDIAADVLIVADATGSMDLTKTKAIVSTGLYSIVATLRRERGLRVAAYAFGGQTYACLTDYDTPMAQSRLIMTDGDGCTYAGSAMQLGVQYMLRHQRPNGGRKILLMMSDGDTSDETLLRAVHTEATRAGIEVIGLSICNGNLVRLLGPKDARRIDDITEFPAALFELLQDRLVA